MNVHPLSLIAALAVGLLIGMVGWHSSRAMSDRDRAPHNAKPEAVAIGLAVFIAVAADGVSMLGSVVRQPHRGQ